MSLDNADTVIEGGPGFDLLGQPTLWVPRPSRILRRAGAMPQAAPILSRGKSHGTCSIVPALAKNGGWPAFDFPDRWPTQRAVRCVGYFGCRHDQSNPPTPTPGFLDTLNPCSLQRRPSLAVQVLPLPAFREQQIHSGAFSRTPVESELPSA